VRFGSELQRLRQTADLSQRELAKATLISHQMLGAVERAERTPRKSFAAKADEVLGARGGLLRLWPGNQDGYPRGFKEYVELEQEAISIQDFQAQVVPGLLQTREYASAVLRAGWPPSENEELERLLEMRVARQRILHRERPPLMWVVVDEGVLRRPVWSREGWEGHREWRVWLAESTTIGYQLMCI